VAALARFLTRLTGQPVGDGDFDPARVPDHLKITFRVVDERRRKMAESKDLAALARRMRPAARQALDRAFAPAPDESAPAWPREGLTRWTIGALPRTVETRRDGQPVKAYPALVEAGNGTAGVRLFDDEVEQLAAMRLGTRRLVLLNLPSDPARQALEKLDNAAKLALASGPHGSVRALLDDCAAAAADRLIAARGGPAWDEEGFGKLLDAVRADIAEASAGVVRQVREVLAAWQACVRRLGSLASPVLRESVADVREQLGGLVHEGFVTGHGAARLPDLLRYLTAADRRLQQLPHHAERDAARLAKVRQLREAYAGLLAGLPPGRPVPRAAGEIRWMIEELRVSYFAHALGTAYPVSDKRVMKAIEAAGGR
jgi:ATP-dependent helicase HrpA